MPIARSLACLIGLVSSVTAEANEIDWPVEFYDPAAAEGAQADLVLPMPCGGAMAFQRIDVPVDGPTPIDDRRLRLGSPRSQTGFVDYLVSAHLRGGFTGAEPAVTHYFLARYELTADQASALRGDCREPTTEGRAPALGLSWFEAIEFGRLHTEWLLANAPDAMPREGSAAGFLRPPTEEEWEYAARGGAAVAPATFATPVHPMDGGLDDHAWHVDVSRGQARPVGVRRANPLGLHDIYGNAEELTLGLFRANAAGRPHGQAGGLVVRGGSYLSSPEQLGSAQRAEWPMYRSSDGRVTAEETFGVRLALSAHVAVDDARAVELANSWAKAVSAGPGVVDDPLEALDEAISEETDQRRLAFLQAARLSLLQERNRSDEAELEAIRANLTSGAVLVSIIRQTSDDIAGFESLREGALAELEKFDVGRDRREPLEGILALAVSELEELEPSLDDALAAYGQALESFASVTDRYQMRRARDRLLGEMAARGWTRLRNNVEEFLSDIETYRTHPGLPREALLRLAIDP